MNKTFRIAKDPKSTQYPVVIYSDKPMRMYKAISAASLKRIESICGKPEDHNRFSVYKANAK